MKLKRILVALLACLSVVFGALGFAACDADDVGGVIDQIKDSKDMLSAPTGLRIEEENLVWNPVEYASGYTVSIDENEYSNDDTSYPLTNVAEGEHTFKVKANGDGLLYKSSDYSVAFIALVEKTQVNEHVWDEGTITTEATCTAEGVKIYACTIEGCEETKTESIPALGHTYESGNCTVCGEIEPNHKHIWDEGVEFPLATCTATGTVTHACMVAGCEETKMEVSPVLGHNNVQYAAKEPGCETVGWNAYEVCGRCGHSTYVELPARGHSFGEGVITKQPTCTENGTMTYSCYCSEHYEVVVAAKGHEYGDWVLSKLATCESNGEEIRYCENDAAHTQTRLTAVLGHNYEKWQQKTAATCVSEGKEQRVCSRNSNHVEYRSIPATGEHLVGSDSICIVCKNLIGKDRLATPTIEIIGENQISWNNVPNAIAYQIKIMPKGDSVTTESTFEDLEKYYGDYKVLQISIKAIAEVGTVYVDSYWAEYSHNVPGEAAKLTGKGIGNAVNLLEGGYTDFITNGNSIFEETEFNKLRFLLDYNVNKSRTKVVASSDLYGYLNEKSDSIGAKLKVDASVGAYGTKITAGYGIELEDTYQTSSYDETSTLYYDLSYYDARYQQEFYNFNMDKLRAAVSQDFLENARKVASGEMSAQAFIDTYGTHVVTAAIYGATMGMHYEVVANKATLSTTVGSVSKESVSAGVEAKLGWVEASVGTEITDTLQTSNIRTMTSESMYSKFYVTTNGGGAGIIATDFASGVAKAQEWKQNISSDNLVIIDVPDETLYSVWEFLDVNDEKYGEEYARAKEVLNEYFYRCCGDDYTALKDKIGDMYSDSILYDPDTKTLTVDVRGFHVYKEEFGDNISISEFADRAYAKEFFADYGEGIFTVYPRYNDNPIEKVVFKGNYYKEDSKGRLITNIFTGFVIRFDEWWDNDIEIEFDGFGYEALPGWGALYFDEVQSENITINVVQSVNSDGELEGKAYVKGGNGATSGACGCIAIYALNKNLTFNGNAMLMVQGGGGKTGVAGGNGGEGGDAICAKNVEINCPLIAWGGAGGDGGNGTPDYGSDCMSGGNGGNGGDGIECDSLKVVNSTVSVYAGNGGNGGNGIRGNDGLTNENYYHDRKEYDWIGAHEDN